MKAITKKIQLHKSQREFRESSSLIRGFTGGIGSGKSWVGAYDLLRRAKPGRLYMVLAPTYRMLDDTSWRSLKSIARDLQFFAGENKTDKIITLGNGAEILGRTADDPDRIRGPNLSGAWFDEASVAAKEAFDIALGRLREGGEQGWMSVTFTPRGKRHWTYKLLTTMPNAKLFVSPTADNPFLPKEFAGSLASIYSPQFARQELGGEFVELEGAELPSSWFGDHAWFERWPNDESIVLKTMSLDPSKGRSDRTGDYSAYVMLAIDNKDTLYVQANLARRPIPQMVADGVALYREFRPNAFTVEGNAWQDLLASDFAEEFRRQSVLAPDVFMLNNQVNKLVRIRRLSGYLSSGRIKFKLGCESTKLLTDQLMDFPAGDHDDGPDALEMAIRIAEDMTQ